ncbi:MAG: VOC family protein [Actinomycetota bacterium]
MDLGAFSVSLSVVDLDRSRAFYEALGFEVFGGNAEEGWVMLRNDSAVIGLFQGMFDGNILTFNPGWNAAAGDVEPFTDVRDIQRRLAERGVRSEGPTAGGEAGPGSFTVTDPDGNVILIDQHR